jgi:hypothetical protein
MIVTVLFAHLCDATGHPQRGRAVRRRLPLLPFPSVLR